MFQLVSTPSLSRMFSGVYGYLFGGEDSNDSLCQSENMDPICSGSGSEEDWCIVDDESKSGRSSPVLIPVPEMRDIDTLSFSSRNSFKPLSAEQIKKSEELREARKANVARLELERVLFAEVDPSMLISTSQSSRVSKSSLASASKLKRATAAAMVATDAKTKSRSKKAVKTPANRNNNRKCQNLD